MKKLLIPCALLGIITLWILTSTAFAHNVLSREPCPSQRFPNEICFFHVVKKGETISRILARYNSAEVILFPEDLSRVPENRDILERKRPLRFKNAWDYLLPDDVIVFPFLAQTTLQEARVEDLAYQLNWLETTQTILGERLRDLEEGWYNRRLNSSLYYLLWFLSLAVITFLVLVTVIMVTRRRRTTASRRAQNRSGA